MSRKSRQRAGEEAVEIVLDRISYLLKSEEFARGLVSYGVVVPPKLQGALETPAPTAGGLRALYEDYSRIFAIHEGLEDFWEPYEEPAGLNPYRGVREAQEAGQLERYTYWGRIGDHLGFDDSE